jgi:hypothetical protein
MKTGSRQIRHALLASALSLQGGCGGVDTPSGAYRPDADVRRLGGAAAFIVDELGPVEDFDLVGDRLYLLERFGRVVLLGRDGSGWRAERTFGRSGAGPGEFRMASGVAVTSDGVVVVDNERVHLFDLDGATLRTESLRLPCPVMRPSVAAARTGIFVHGNCFRYALATDTVKAVLAWSPAVSGDGPFRVLAEEVRFTRDGTVGTIFGAPKALTESAAGDHLFGAGIENCVWHIADPGVPSEPQQQCPVAARLYSAPPSPDVRRRLQAGIPGMRVTWPKTLPVYIDRIRVGDSLVLVRPFASDSVVLQTAAPDSRDLAVAEFRGFVGCRAGGCLWFDDRDGVPRLTLLEIGAIRALLAGQWRDT